MKSLVFFKSALGLVQKGDVLAILREIRSRLGAIFILLANIYIS